MVGLWWPKSCCMSYVCLLRFDQTDGKIVPKGMEPEWRDLRLFAKPPHTMVRDGSARLP
ncbi:hypothetical protein KL86DES1_21114 [uncultured Desulfovibrio sp.]|uniref:Uncharacterized protein n=1 Tax=uncultured Desulfovibrio sp. TaxID=167968 RepID=A0A212L6P0_9BACT|nr:hypothetical protein KL86DES1_21114 [uncultured Desulfovibrio sp.]VZH34012.1 conserved protein of unknown function [Desulfovibrio sp. 86]